MVLSTLCCEFLSIKSSADFNICNDGFGGNALRTITACVMAIISPRMPMFQRHAQGDAAICKRLSQVLPQAVPQHGTHMLVRVPKG